MRIFFTWDDWALDIWREKRLNGSTLSFIHVGPIHIRWKGFWQ
jgi:hypothetical protein